MKVEKIAVRFGSSTACAAPVGLLDPSGVKSRGMASAMVRSRDVSGVISLIMHPIVPGCPSKPAAKSGSASYISVVASAAS